MKTYLQKFRSRLLIKCIKKLMDSFDLDAIYFSYSDTTAEFLYLDKDRLRAQKQMGNRPQISRQLEMGLVEYEGHKKRFGNNVIKKLTDKEQIFRFLGLSL